MSLSELLALYITKTDESYKEQILEQIELLLQKELLFCKQLQNIYIEQLIVLKKQRNLNIDNYWRPLQ